MQQAPNPSWHSRDSTGKMISVGLAIQVCSAHLVLPRHTVSVPWSWSRPPCRNKPGRAMWCSGPLQRRSDWPGSRCSWTETISPAPGSTWWNRTLCFRPHSLQNAGTTELAPLKLSPDWSASACANVNHHRPTCGARSRFLTALHVHCLLVKHACWKIQTSQTYFFKYIYIYLFFGLFVCLFCFSLFCI